MSNALIPPEPSDRRSNRAAWRALTDWGVADDALFELNEMNAICRRPRATADDAAAGDVPAPMLMAAFRAAAIHKLRMSGVRAPTRAAEFVALNTAVNARFRRYARR